MPEHPLPALDDEPKSGVYVDHDDAELTAEDIAAGQALGRLIDVDDDGDTGLGRL